jgi:hypothetical protein
MTAREVWLVEELVRYADRERWEPLSLTCAANERSGVAQLARLAWEDSERYRLTRYVATDTDTKEGT